MINLSYVHRLSYSLIISGVQHVSHCKRLVTHSYALQGQREMPAVLFRVDSNYLLPCTFSRSCARLLKSDSSKLSPIELN